MLSQTDTTFNWLYIHLLRQKIIYYTETYKTQPKKMLQKMCKGSKLLWVCTFWPTPWPTRLLTADKIMELINVEFPQTITPPCIRNGTRFSSRYIQTIPKTVCVLTYVIFRIIGHFNVDTMCHCLNSQWLWWPLGFW